MCAISFLLRYLGQKANICLFVFVHACVSLCFPSSMLKFINTMVWHVAPEILNRGFDYCCENKCSARLSG